MALIEIPKDPSPSTLRWFGALLGLFCALLGAVLLWRSGPGSAWVLFALAIGLPLLYYGVPPLRRPMFFGWMYAAWPIGTAISLLLLAVVWYGVVTPIGLCMRLLGRDPMQRRLDRDASTYWTPHGGRPPAERYFRPY